MNKFLKLVIWGCILSMTLGFRVMSGKWEITKTDPTLWVRVCQNNFTIDENDISGDDPLAGVSGLTFAQVMQSVINDYNNIPTSFVRLALYPADPNNPGSPASGDSAFTIESASKRTIDICFGETDTAAGLSGGYAKLKYEGRTIVGCSITGRTDALKKAHFLTHLITHEMGHCFGLMHPQESTRSVMSYFGEKKTRLQHDDDAGITHLYPEEESYSKESSTFGLTGCEPAK